ncbi:uncharacterized protein LOC111883863 isoform X1 [Lactuca sativa]|uniref:uncharacterized protein LOC111883863 isoform X1 n=1 Tax=Lactuca sativa TaxID=4236 RepID=UPI001C6877A5|nr:uncharacterized protein LOC111883863 isoform X1 [Lactuca sativa]
MKMYVRIGFHRLCSVRVLHRHTNHLHLIRLSASANQNRFLTFCFNFNALADLFPPNQSSLAKSLSITSIRSNRKSTQLYLVTSSYGEQVYFSMERAAAPYFGINAYGVYMCGYVEKDGEKYMWSGKRSEMKQTYPGMLDHLVAGGMPHGISPGDNLVKECEEEAGISSSISSRVSSKCSTAPISNLKEIVVNIENVKNDKLKKIWKY